MDELMDAQAVVSLCNAVLAFTGIPTPVTCLQEVQALGASVSLFVAATEVLLACRLDKLHRHPSNSVERAANCATVLGALCAALPGLELSHILPSAVVAGDMLHIQSLLELLAELSSMPDVPEQPDTEAGQTAVAGSRPSLECQATEDSSRNRRVPRAQKSAPAASFKKQHVASRDTSTSRCTRSPVPTAVANSTAAPANLSSSCSSSSRSPTKRMHKTNRATAVVRCHASSASTTPATKNPTANASEAETVEHAVPTDLYPPKYHQQPLAVTVGAETATAAQGTTAAADSSYGTADLGPLSRAACTVLAVARDPAEASKLSDGPMCHKVQQLQQQGQQGQQVVCNDGQTAAAAAAAGDTPCVDTHQALHQLQLALNGAAALLQQQDNNTDVTPSAARINGGTSLQESSNQADIAHVACDAADSKQQREQYIEAWVAGAADAGSPQQQQQDLHGVAAPTATMHLLNLLLKEQTQVQSQLDKLLTQQQAEEQTEQQQYTVQQAARPAVQQAIHRSLKQRTHSEVQPAVQPAVQLLTMQSGYNSEHHCFPSQQPAEQKLQQPTVLSLGPADAPAAAFQLDDGTAVAQQVPESRQVDKCSRLVHLHNTTLALLAEVQQQQRKLLQQQQDAMQLCKQAEAAAATAAVASASQPESAPAPEFQPHEAVPNRTEALAAGQQLLLNQKSVLEASLQQINVLMAGLQSTEQRLLLQQQQIFASMLMEAVQLTEMNHQQQQPITMALQAGGPAHLIDALQQEQAQPPPPCTMHHHCHNHQQQQQQQQLGVSHPGTSGVQPGSSEQLVRSSGSSRTSQNSNNSSSTKMMPSSSNNTATNGRNICDKQQLQQGVVQPPQQCMQRVLCMASVPSTSASTAAVTTGSKRRILSNTGVKHAAAHKSQAQPVRRSVTGSSSRSSRSHTKSTQVKPSQHCRKADARAVTAAACTHKSASGSASRFAACQPGCSSNSSIGSWAGDGVLVSDTMDARDVGGAPMCATQQQAKATAAAMKVAAASAEHELASQRAWQQQLLKQYATEARRLQMKRQQQEELREKQKEFDHKLSQLQEQRNFEQACRDAEQLRRQAAAHAAAEAAEAAPATGLCTHHKSKTAAAGGPVANCKASAGRPALSPAAAKAASRLCASYCSAKAGMPDNSAATQSKAGIVQLHELQQLRQEYQQLLGVFEGLLVSERRGRMEAERMLAQLERQQRTESRQRQRGSRISIPMKSPAR